MTSDADGSLESIIAALAGVGTAGAHRRAVTLLTVAELLMARASLDVRAPELRAETSALAGMISALAEHLAATDEH